MAEAKTEDNKILEGFKKEPVVKQLCNYFKAGFPIIYLSTPEEGRAEIIMLEVAKELKCNVVYWSHTEGFIRGGKENKGQVIVDPIAALTEIKSEAVSQLTIYVVRDLHPFIKAPKVRRLLRDCARDFQQLPKRLVLLSPIVEIDQDLDRDTTLVEMGLPTRETAQIIYEVVASQNPKIFANLDENEKERIIEATLGLTTNEAMNCIGKAAIESKETGKTISSIVMKEKANTVKKTGILEHFESGETSSDIGGLEVLKEWITVRKMAFTPKAREFGLPMPKGILLVGLPGCGKSLACKAIANALGVPLIKLEIGRIFGGLVGQSESNLRGALDRIDAIGNCVVWIDEMEKAFAGLGSSGSTDSGVSKRIFGQLINWMQEKKSPSFIAATVNRLDLPPELIRKGRFDEIFFVGLPDEKERVDILKIHVAKKKRDFDRIFDKSDITTFTNRTKGFSGAEIEAAVISGLFTAFSRGEDLKADFVLSAVFNTVPLSEARASDLREMSEWAEKNAVNASVRRAVKVGKNFGREIDVG